MLVRIRVGVTPIRCVFLLVRGNAAAKTLLPTGNDVNGPCRKATWSLILGRELEEPLHTLRGAVLGSRV